jgi:raffinose/stachyose/melibiose transport system substrate-binding protein
MEGVDPRIAAIFIDLAAASDSGGYGYTTWTFWPPRSNAYIYEEIERIWSGDITAEEYLQGLDDLFQEEFAAGAGPPIPERR